VVFPGCTEAAPTMNRGNLGNRQRRSDPNLGVQATEKTVRLPFSKSRLDAIPTPAEGQAQYHDTGCPRLCLRVSCGGSKRSCGTARSAAGPRGCTWGGSRN